MTEPHSSSQRVNLGVLGCEIWHKILRLHLVAGAYHCSLALPCPRSAAAPEQTLLCKVQPSPLPTWSPEPSHHASWEAELTLTCVSKLGWIWHAGGELGGKDHGQKSLALQPFSFPQWVIPMFLKNLYITVSSQICYPLRLLSVPGEVTTVWMFREQHKALPNSFLHKSVPLPVFPMTE